MKKRFLILFFVFYTASILASDLPHYNTPTYQDLPQACPDAQQACIITELKKLTSHLCVADVININPDYWESSRHPQPLPTYNSSSISRPLYLPVNIIKFMQASASGIFTDLKHDLIESAYALQNGELDPEAFPTIEVWQDNHNNIWTLNHRRLIAILMSGNIKIIKVKWVDRATLISNQQQFTTTNNGDAITIWITDTAALYVNHACKKI